MSTLEQSIRKFAEEPTNSMIKPEIGTSFDSLGEAYDFYNLYSWEVGFGIRYGESRLNAEDRVQLFTKFCGTRYYMWVSFFVQFWFEKRHHGVT